MGIRGTNSFTNVLTLTRILRAINNTAFSNVNVALAAELWSDILNCCNFRQMSSVDSQFPAVGLWPTSLRLFRNTSPGV